jgi:hypothetical protein
MQEADLTSNEARIVKPIAAFLGKIDRRLAQDTSGPFFCEAPPALCRERTSDRTDDPRTRRSVDGNQSRC